MVTVYKLALKIDKDMKVVMFEDEYKSMYKMTVRDILDGFENNDCEVLETGVIGGDMFIKF